MNSSQKFDHYYELMERAIRLQGLRPKTMEAYLRTIRRVNDRVDKDLDELTPEDLTSGRSFEDDIGLFGLIDDKQTFIDGNGWYGIPYRALLPEGVEGLLMAGRSIGRDDLVHTSTRMMACCMVQGEGAGTAAALAALADEDPSQVEAATLREALLFADVILEA